jgi:GTP-binding protein
MKMIIHSASYIKSSPSIKQCPAPVIPEYGFIGRSNTGKSSLINMLTGWSKLARISGEPGKTRTINHYLINDKWYLVDLPGYGYARVPDTIRKKWMNAVREYILQRETLVSLFVLLDCRLIPQKPDIEFMEFLGRNKVPFARVFTKTDKINHIALEKSVQQYDTEMLKNWESLPVTFTASAVRKTGREEILNFIEESLNKLSKEAYYNQE